jgi:hypothetical protein
MPPRGSSGVPARPSRKKATFSSVERQPVSLSCGDSRRDQLWILLRQIRAERCIRFRRCGVEQFRKMLIRVSE